MTSTVYSHQELARLNVFVFITSYLLGALFAYMWLRRMFASIIYDRSPSPNDPTFETSVEKVSTQTTHPDLTAAQSMYRNSTHDSFKLDIVSRNTSGVTPL